MAQQLADAGWFLGRVLAHADKGWGCITVMRGWWAAIASGEQQGWLQMKRKGKQKDDIFGWCFATWHSGCVRCVVTAAQSRWLPVRRATGAAAHQQAQQRRGAAVYLAAARGAAGGSLMKGCLSASLGVMRLSGSSCRGGGQGGRRVGMCMVLATGWCTSPTRGGCASGPAPSHCPL